MLASLLGLARFTVSSGGVSQAPRLSPAGVCLREGAKLVGKIPVRPGKGIAAPKKLRSVNPTYPQLPSGTSGSGMWMGEVLLNAEGKVAHVWPIREVRFTPAFPAFNQAIVDAIGQWEFEPLLLKGEATPVCLTTTVNINWR